jgi:hypothetical protein
MIPLAKEMAEDRLPPPLMRDPSRPRLTALIHGLWPDRRLLRSPLWLIPLTALLCGLVLTFWTMFKGFAQLPLLATVLVCSLSWHRVHSSGLARDWTLAGRGRASLAAATFTSPWMLWWASVTALQIALLWRSYGRDFSSQVLLVLIPGGPVLYNHWNPDDIDWAIISVTICMALVPFHLALWALVHRRVTELTVTSQGNPVAGIAVALVCCLGLWWCMRRIVHFAACQWAMDLQGRWSSDWPLGLKLQMGAWLAWLLYLPLLLSTWCFLLILVRQQRRRWEPERTIP